MSVNSRLKRLERSATSGGDFADVLSWIRAGRFYDELDDSQKEKYCAYQGFPRKGMEDVENMIRGNLHIALEYKPKPLTQDEIRERAEWVQTFMEERSREYNSPENQEKRRREYEELQEVGRKRREAFYAGLPMDTYPLPWDK